MKPGFWRRLRFLMHGTTTPRGAAPRVPISAGEHAGGPAGDALVDALLSLRTTVEQGLPADLALAWFRVDEAKAGAVWYDGRATPPYPAVLPEEQLLAAQVYRGLTGHEPTLARLVAGEDRVPPMVRYRLLVAALPAAAEGGGRRAAEAVQVCYGFIARPPDVLSPYGRWLLARAVCLAARDREELARQAERLRAVTADHRAADGSSMAFVSGGEFELPLPVSLTDVLDCRGMPTCLDAFKREAPKEIQRFFLRLTPRGHKAFLRAFLRRQNAYRNGYPWRRPPWLASEGTVFVRVAVQLSPYFIDRRPITNAQYEQFAQAHGRWLPSRVSAWSADPDTYLPGWHGDRPPRGALTEPVTGVSYQACRAYAAALGKQLPSEAQWLYALAGPELPETRLAGDARPAMSDEERAQFGRGAAERGLHVGLPERVYDFDGSCRFTLAHAERPLVDPRGPGSGNAHLWRTPASRGRVRDRMGDANLTFRGVIPASRVWAGTEAAPSASHL